MKNININKAYEYANYIVSLKNHIEVNARRLPGCPVIYPKEYDELLHHVELAINRLKTIDYAIYDITSLKVYIYAYMLVPMVYGELAHANVMNEFVKLINTKNLSKADLKTFITNINIK